MHRLYAHLVWTTRDRQPLINAGRARLLERYLRVAARHHRARVLALGMVATHVHVLVAFEPMTTLSRLVQSLKGGSATVLNRELPEPPPLRWARGYSIHSVGYRHLEVVRRYLALQHEHHPLERIPDWHPPPALSARSNDVPLAMIVSAADSRGSALRSHPAGDSARR